MNKSQSLLSKLNESDGYTVATALAELRNAVRHDAIKSSNPNAAGIALGAFDDYEKEFPKKDSSDPEDLKKVLKKLPGYFTTKYRDWEMPEYPSKFSFSGINKVVRKIAKQIGVQVD